jgi:hypothetical protein
MNIYTTLRIGPYQIKQHKYGLNHTDDLAVIRMVK